MRFFLAILIGWLVFKVLKDTKFAPDSIVSGISKDTSVYVNPFDTISAIVPNPADPPLSDPNSPSAKKCCC